VCETGSAAGTATGQVATLTLVRGRVVLSAHSAARPRYPWRAACIASRSRRANRGG